MIAVGTVVRAHGIKGYVRVRASSDAILSAKKVQIEGREYEIERAQPERTEFLVKLAGVDTRNDAELLRGKTLEVERWLLAPLAPGEVYVADLIDCKLYDTQGKLLGIVKDVFFTGGHETLVVADAATAREFMVPFVGAIVTEVDTAGKRLVCDPPEGLLDLDRADG